MFSFSVYFSLYLLKGYIYMHILHAQNLDPYLNLNKKVYGRNGRNPLMINKIFQTLCTLQYFLSLGCNKWFKQTFLIKHFFFDRCIILISIHLLPKFTFHLCSLFINFISLINYWYSTYWYRYERYVDFPLTLVVVWY